jgi:hypothetical protein
MAWGTPPTTVTLRASITIACPVFIGQGCCETEHEFRAEANAQLPLLAEEEKEIRDALRKSLEESVKIFLETHHS